MESKYKQYNILDHFDDLDDDDNGMSTDLNEMLDLNDTLFTDNVSFEDYSNNSAPIQFQPRRLQVSRDTHQSITRRKHKPRQKSNNNNRTCFGISAFILIAIFVLIFSPFTATQSTTPDPNSNNDDTDDNLEENSQLENPSDGTPNQPNSYDNNIYVINHSNVGPDQQYDISHLNIDEYHLESFKKFSQHIIKDEKVAQADLISFHQKSVYIPILGDFGSSPQSFFYDIAPTKSTPAIDNHKNPPYLNQQLYYDKYYRNPKKIHPKDKQFDVALTLTDFIQSFRKTIDYIVVVGDLVYNSGFTSWYNLYASEEAKMTELEESQASQDPSTPHHALHTKHKEDWVEEFAVHPKKSSYNNVFIEMFNTFYNFTYGSGPSKDDDTDGENTIQWLLSMGNHDYRTTTLPFYSSHTTPTRPLSDHPTTTTATRTTSPPAKPKPSRLTTLPYPFYSYSIPAGNNKDLAFIITDTNMLTCTDPRDTISSPLNSKFQNQRGRDQPLVPRHYESKECDRNIPYLTEVSLNQLIASQFAVINEKDRYLAFIDIINPFWSQYNVFSQHITDDPVLLQNIKKVSDHTIPTISQYLAQWAKLFFTQVNINLDPDIGNSIEKTLLFCKHADIQSTDEVNTLIQNLLIHNDKNTNPNEHRPGFSLDDYDYRINTLTNYINSLLYTPNHVTQDQYDKDDFDFLYHTTFYQKNFIESLLVDFKYITRDPRTQHSVVHDHHDFKYNTASTSSNDVPTQILPPEISLLYTFAILSPSPHAFIVWINDVYYDITSGSGGGNVAHNIIKDHFENDFTQYYNLLQEVGVLQQFGIHLTELCDQIMTQYDFTNVAIDKNHVNFDAAKLKQDHKRKKGKKDHLDDNLIPLQVEHLSWEDVFNHILRPDFYTTFAHAHNDDHHAPSGAHHSHDNHNHIDNDDKSRTFKTLIYTNHVQLTSFLPAQLSLLIRLFAREQHINWFNDQYLGYTTKNNQLSTSQQSIAHVFVVGHHPLVTVSRHQTNIVLLGYLSPLFTQQNMDGRTPDPRNGNVSDDNPIKTTYLCGHDHILSHYTMQYGQATPQSNMNPFTAYHAGLNIITTGGGGFINNHLPTINDLLTGPSYNLRFCYKERVDREDNKNDYNLPRFSDPIPFKYEVNTIMDILGDSTKGTNPNAGDIAVLEKSGNIKLPPHLVYPSLSPPRAVFERGDSASRAAVEPLFYQYNANIARIETKYGQFFPTTITHWDKFMSVQNKNNEKDDNTAILPSATTHMISSMNGFVVLQVWPQNVDDKGNIVPPAQYPIQKQTDVAEKTYISAHFISGSDGKVIYTIWLT